MFKKKSKKLFHKQSGARALSLLLAGVMIFGSGLLQTPVSVQAANGGHKVTLEDADGGKTTFADSETDESEMYYESGDLVVLNLAPEKNKLWKGSHVLNSNGEEKLGVDEQGYSGQENFYFVMPDYPVTVTSEYVTDYTDGDRDMEAECTSDDEKSVLDPNAGISLMSTVGKNKATIDRGTNLTYGDGANKTSTADYKIKIGGVTFHGFCAEPKRGNPDNGEKKDVKILKSGESRNNVHVPGDWKDTVKRLAVLGTAKIGGESNPGLNADFFNSLDGISKTDSEVGNSIVGAHLCIGMVYNNNDDDKGLDSADVAKIEERIAAANAYNFTAEGINLDSYTLYVAIGGSKQDIVWIEMEPYGNVKLKKYPKCPEYVTGNSAYDMTGAEYGIFSDAACTDLLDTVIVQDNTGITNESIELSAGTYYVKETKKASKGYLLNPNVQAITVTADNTTTQHLNTQPMLEEGLEDPLNIIVQKAISDWDKAGKLEGDIKTLAGIKFRVDYYRNLYSSADAAKASGNPTASAVFETSDVGGNGFLRFSTAKPVNGTTWPYKGETGLNILPLGTIVITEVSTIDGLIIRSPQFGQAFTLTDNGDGTTKRTILGDWPNQEVQSGPLGAFENQPEKGGVSVIKADADWHTSSPQGDATLTGTEYQIINKSANSVKFGDKEIPVDGIVTTISSKYDETAKAYVAATANNVLPYGTYEMVETKAPTGYNKATWSQRFEIRENEYVQLYHTTDSWNEDAVQRGGITIGKVDRETKQYISLGEAHLDGAVFEVINKSEHPVYVNGKTYAVDEKIMDIATEEMEVDGRKIYAATTGNNILPYGTYELHEISSGTGYLFDKASKAYTTTVQVRGEGDMVNVTKESDVVANQVIREDWHFQKKAEDSMERLANVAFVVKSLTTGERHVIVTDENGTWGSDFTSHTAKTNSNDPTSPITNGALGVDENGDWYVKDSSKLDCNAGTWFTGMKEDLTKWAEDGKSYMVNDVKVDVNNKLRSFPYDTYTVQELACDANEGYNLVNFTVTLHRYTSDHDGPGLDIDYGTVDDRRIRIGTTLTHGDSDKVVPAGAETKLRDAVTYDNLTVGEKYLMKGELHLVNPDGTDGGVIGTAEQEFTPKESAGRMNMEFTVDTSKLGGKSLVAFEFLNYKGKVIAKHEDLEDEDQTVTVPEIQTIAKGDLGQLVNAGGAEVRVTDTITYKGLEVGKTYTAHGTLMDKNTGEAILDADGKPITAETTFAAAKKDGTVDVVFVFSGVDVSGKTGVAFETITKDDVEYAVHADIEDADQTVYFPKVDSYAVDGADHNKELAEAKGQTIQEAVKTENLDKSYEYKLVGELHVRNADGSDGGVLKDADGKAVKEEVTWTGNDTNHTMEFKDIDASKLGGKDLVVLQTLYGRLVDEKSEESKDDAKEESKDESKDEAKKAKEESKEESKDESKDESKEESKDEKWVIIGEHKDISDKDQSVHVPHIGTTLVDGQGIHESQIPEDGKVTLTDTVSYENLTPGREYTLTGILHIQEVSEDGKITDGGELKDGDKAVEGTATFTPEKANGKTEVIFTFDASELSGKSLTAFEKLYSVSAKDIADDWKEFFPDDGKEPEKPEKTVVAEHEDIEDEGQTVHFAKIKTTLTTESGSHATQVPVVEDKTVTLTDTVSYKNFIPGHQYTVTGTLHVKEIDEEGNVKDGGALKDAEGNEITAETTFTAEKADGDVEVVFTFDAAELAGKTVVAFESASTNDKTFAVHADIEDEAQSVHFVKIRTTATGENGEHEITIPDGKSKTIKITDVVEYKNLIPGLEYKMSGEFHTRAINGDGEIVDGGVLTDADGNAITSEVTFKAEEADGSVEVVFELDASRLGDNTIVAFETLTLDDVVVATHADITDEAQAVTIIPNPEDEMNYTPNDVVPSNGGSIVERLGEIIKTGQAPLYLLFALIGIALMAGGGYAYIRRKRK